jgi:hypothetical protein
MGQVAAAPYMAGTLCRYKYGSTARPASTIAAAVTSQASFIKLLEAANPDRQPATIEADGFSVLKGASTYQYAAVNISSPNAIDTHATDGPDIFVSFKNGWHYLGSPSLCGSKSNVANALSQLGVTDTGAWTVISNYCGSLGL